MATSKNTKKPVKKATAKQAVAAKKAMPKAPAKPIVKPAATPQPKAPAQPATAPTASCCSTEKSACCCGFTSFCVCNTLRTMCPVFQVLSTLKFWVATLIAFVVVFLFQGFWHGSLLMDNYMATAAMWRTPETMDPNLFYISQALTALVLVALVQLMGQRTWWGGTVSGILASAPFAIGALMSYITMPFADGHIPLMWAAGDLLQGALVGLVATIVFKSPYFATGCACGPTCACGPSCDCGPDCCK